MSTTFKSALAALALAFLTLPAAAQITGTGTASITMAPGTPTVSFTSGLTFGSVNLTGQAISDAVSTADLVLQVNDNSGDGDGWTLGASCTAFTGPDAKTGLAHTIPAANLTLNGTGATFSSNNSGYTAPASKADIAAMTGSAQTFVTAGTGEGVGLQTVTVPAANVLLDVPYNAAAGAYSSTVTFTLADL